MRMFDVMEILLAAAVGIYIFFRVRRLLRFYGVGGKRTVAFAISLLAGAGVGAACVDLWTTRAMVALHLAGLSLATDIIALLIREIQCIFSARSEDAGKAQKPGDGTGASGKNRQGKGHAFWRRLYGCGLIPVLALALIFLYGNYNMNHIRQTCYQVETDKLVGSYRVVLMTDIHYGTIQDSDILKNKLAEINELHPDMVVLGGDIVEEGTSGDEMREVFRVLGSLESRFGIFYIYGNHDRQPYTVNRTYSDDELEQAIESAGIRILRDEYIEIGDDLVLAGREDAIIARYLTYRITPEEILRGVSRDKYIIMVDHEPVEAEENAAQGVDLMLSGHTHAGQVWPVGILNELTGTLNYGEYQRGACKVIVSSGVAGWGYSIRTQERCEYVVVDIVGRAGEQGIVYK